MMEKKALLIWKEIGAERAIFEFDCGGDSMNYTQLEIYDSKRNIIENLELETILEKLIYKNIDFYVDSDGHYLGEYGHVEIIVDENEFIFTKISNGEYCGIETHKETINYQDLSFEIKDKDKISEIFIKLDSSFEKVEINVSYKEDCIVEHNFNEMIEYLRENALKYYSEKINSSFDIVDDTYEIDITCSLTTDNQINFTYEHKFDYIS